MGGRYSKHRADRALFHVQSASLDSISTAASLSTCRNGNVPTHSPSMDTIHQRSKLPGKQPIKQVKGNTYMLLDTASTDYEAASLLEEEEERTGVRKGGGGEGGRRERVAGASGGREAEREDGKGKGREVCDKALEGGRLVEEGEGEGGGGGEEKAHLTSSLPSEVERHIGRAEGVDEFSEVLLTRDGQMDGESNTNKPKTCQNVSPSTEHSEMEREVQQLLKSVLKQSRQASKNGYSHSSDTTTASEVPEAVLHLSSKDLDQLAMYLCSKFKDTLQTSLVKKVLQQQQKEQQMKQRTKHVQISEDPISFRTATENSDSPHSSEHMAGYHGRPGEERLQRRRPRRPRRERPNSTPGIYWKDDPHLNLSDPQNSTTARLAHDSPSPPHHLQARSHSHEDCYHHKCTTDQSPDPTAYGCTRQPPCRACRENGRTSPNREHSHGGGRRKRQGRSKDTPVDVSLDDNCPGVNLVRRRQHHHHHSVCENCLQSLGKVPSRHSRRRPKQQHSFEMPNCKDTPLSEEDSATRGVGEGMGFITLDQLRTVAQMLNSSTGFVEQNPQQQQSGRQGNGPTKSQSFRQERRQQCHVKSKRKSAHLDDAVSGTPIELLPEDKDADCGLSTPEELGKLQELVYPMKLRSGRDSPATDMAVIDLSVDSPCMLQPLEGKEPPHSSTSVFFGNSSPDRVMHLHHHYHHIIHHSEP